jgi:hypothetical protein
MSPTPLSDAISALVAHDDPATYDRLVQTFLGERLGVIASGLPATHGASIRIEPGQRVTCAVTDLPDGRTMVLACADLPTFVTRFDRPFNAELDAAALMNIVMANPDCAGIFINSATSEHSAAIDRATIERLVGLASKPWWKFW